MSKIFLLSAVCLSALLSGCFNLSPAYKTPAIAGPLPVAYKEDNNWKTAAPAEHLPAGPWWEMFGDQTLNALMADLNLANQNIAVAAANLRRARTQVSAARSAFMPTISAPGQITRSGVENGIPQTSYSYGVNASWELSFWNAIPAFEASKAQAEASAADYAAMRLAMQAELAVSYFQLRLLDSQYSLYESTIAAYAKAVQLTRSQYQGGVVTPVDVAQAEAQLASAEAQLAAIQRQRAELEHGIAILTGRLPSDFSLNKDLLAAKVPSIPTGLPSALLERRPDIASAERRVAAANEQIGLARAAWFPKISLGAEDLLKGVGLASTPLYAWSVGPSAALSLFQGGKRLADMDAAKAGYEAEVATYRQSVLQAFKEVEDNLSALRYLEKEAAAQDRAVLASQAALRLSLSQYRGGLTTYLQVVNSQTAALTNERSALQAQGARLTAAVNLIKALGGGWQAADIQNLMSNLPTEGSISR